MINDFNNDYINICPICNSDYNNFSGTKENWKTDTCNCYLQNKLWRDYSLANIPRDLYSKDINDYEFKFDENKQYFQNILKYIEYLDKVFENGSSLLLYSDLSSVGKTFFATSILKEAYRKNYSIYFLQFIYFYNEITNVKNYQNYFDKINKYDFLVIDSVDKHVKREFMTDIKFLNLFEEFLRKRSKPTIFTSQKSLFSDLETLKVIKDCFKNKIYEIHIDNPQQYNPNDYWQKIMVLKKKIFK